MNSLLKKAAFLSMTAILLCSCGNNNTSESGVVPTDTTPISSQVSGTSGDDDDYIKEYYQDINDSMSGETLKNALYSIIHPTRCTGSYDGIWNIIRYSDAANPEKSSDDHQIIAFYRGTAGARSSMNKEHVWPKSRGGHAIDGDPHMVRPTFTSDNSSRGNDFYNESPTSYDPNEFGAPQYRGIAARIIFYCAVQQKDALKLVDKTTDSTTSTTQGTMGKLSTLLKWNLQYGVDQTEIQRNEVLNGRMKSHGKTFSYNRNPFIDDPGYACRIWGSTNSTTKKICGM